MKVFLSGIKRRPILTLIIVLAALVLGISLPGAVAAMTTSTGPSISALANIGGGGGAGQVAFFTSGTDVGSDANLTWDNTNKRLGIGTATPSRLLHIKGNIALFERNVNSAGFIIERDGADVAGYNRWVFGVDEPTGFVIKTYPYDGATAVEQLVISKDDPSTPDNESKIGIGTTSPTTAKLVVAGGTFTNGIDSTGNSIAVKGTNTSNSNFGYIADANNGVYGFSQSSNGVGGNTYSGNGVNGFSVIGNGVYGSSTSGYAGYFQGNAQVTGTVTTSNINYSIPRTHYYSIAGDTFTPRNSSTAYSQGIPNGGAYVTTNYAALVAPVHLPDGAIIQEFKVFFDDNSSYNLSVSLLVQIISAWAYTDLANVASVGISGYGSASTTTISAPTINNQLYGYFVRAYWETADGDNLKIMGAVITYTIAEAE